MIPDYVKRDPWNKTQNLGRMWTPIDQLSQVVYQVRVLHYDMKEMFIIFSKYIAIDPHNVNTDSLILLR